MKYIRKTSPEVGFKLIEVIKKPFRNPFILEPSAGEGDLADFVSYAFPNSIIDCFELNSNKKEVLKNKGYNVIGRDFLLHDPSPVYDIIIAAPPFTKNIDLFHISHMYNFLNNGGVLVSLISPLFLINNEEHQVNFRKFLESKKHSFVLLRDNSFIEKKKTVPTMILRIEK